MTRKTRKDKKRKKQVSRILVFLFVLTVYLMVFPHTVGIQNLRPFAALYTSVPLQPSSFQCQLDFSQKNSAIGLNSPHELLSIVYCTVYSQELSYTAEWQQCEESNIGCLD